MAGESEDKPLVTLAKNAYVLLVLAPISLFIFTYERALTPLYGLGPVQQHLNKFVVAGAMLAAINPLHFKPWINWLVAGVALTIAPNATYWVAVFTGREHNSLFGVLKTHAAVALPIVFAMSGPVMRALDATAPRDGIASISNTSNNAPVVYRATRTAVIFFVAKGLASEFWYLLKPLRQVSESQIFLGLAGLYYAAFILSVPSPLAFLSSKPKKAAKKPAPKRKSEAPAEQKESTKETASNPVLSTAYRLTALAAFTGLWTVAYPYLKNPVLPHPLLEPYSHPTEPLKILSAVQSVTGLITVAEWQSPQSGDTQGATDVLSSARYLRASHSLLGGVWTYEKVAVLPGQEPLKDSFGTYLGDSIYSAFTLQEAARLVDSTAKGKAGSWESALVIGLGTGISTGALIRHGINTTIVELDPAVYDAARTYFGLPDPGEGNVHIQDARRWVFQHARALSEGTTNKKFDIVIHDLFSGGGVPADLFTKQFWTALKSIIDEEAVVVVNFAGLVKSEASSLVVNTLVDAFGQCRGFHDLFQELPKDKYDSEFLNMVLFCSPSKTRLTFRQPRNSDYLGSYLRRHVLSSLDSREIDLNVIRSDSPDQILNDGDNKLGPLQAQQGGHHWEVMRGVLPDFHWETY